jgi:starvation-inducible DNA-binding protein
MDIGITATDRAEIAAGLSRLLADSFTLYLLTHNFHWNVKGPMFNSLHQMFMVQYTEQWNALDVIAERIRALGIRPRAPSASSPAWPPSRRRKACPRRRT